VLHLERKQSIRFVDNYTIASTNDKATMHQLDANHKYEMPSISSKVFSCPKNKK
jgi:hypothetical protein